MDSMATTVVRLQPSSGAGCSIENKAALLRTLAEFGDIALYIILTPDVIRLFVVGEQDIELLHAELDGTLSGWTITKSKFTVSLPGVDADTITKVNFQGVGKYTRGYILGQAGSTVDDSASPSPPVNSLIDILARKNQTAVYRVAATEEDVSQKRSGYIDALEETSPNISGKWFRGFQQLIEDDTVETHDEYEKIIKRLQSRNFNTLGLNAQLYLAGEDARETADTLESVFKAVGSKYYRTVGNTSTVPRNELPSTPQPTVSGSLPSAVPLIKRFRSNGSEKIIVSPQAAAEYALPAVGTLSDRARRRLTTNRSPSP
jgi:hypothetical protein